MNLVLLILAVLWALVLIPPALRARAESSHADSIGSFRRQLLVLKRTGPTAPAGAPARVVRVSHAQKRRRDILFGLLAAMAGSLLLGFVPSLRVMWSLHVVLDALFLAYFTMLVRMRTNAAERADKVRVLRASPREAQLLLRRTGN